jgi:hypothetical protein
MAELAKALFKVYDKDRKRLIEFLKNKKKVLTGKQLQRFLRRHARHFIPKGDVLRRDIQAVIDRFKDAVDITTGLPLLTSAVMQVLTRLLTCCMLLAGALMRQ